MKKWFLCMMALMLFATAASAESVTLEGTVVSTKTSAILAPAAGILDEMMIQAGDTVAEGIDVASLMGTKVYAEEAGIVHVFGQEGDSVESLTERYGAVVYVEPEVLYTMSASTRYAYDSVENKIIHPGEKVYLECISECDHIGQGVVTLVEGTNFTVEVTGGQFKSSETVRVYRSESLESTSRIGRGTMEQASPAAYTGSGTVTKIYVVNGEAIESGALLYETVETDAYSDRILSPETGVVAYVAATAGDTVEKGTLLAEIYPADAMRLMVEADEYDLRKLTIGSKVDIEFTCGIKAEGVVERVSGIQQEADSTEEDAEDEDALFAVYIHFIPERAVSYGMTAKITTTNAN